MRTVTREEIVQVWDKLCAMERAESESTAKRFMREQPALGIFVTVNVEDQAEDSRSIELVVAAWKAMTQAAGRRLKMITPEQVEAAEEVNTETLWRLDEGSEIEFTDFTRDMMETYKQRVLIGFAIEILMSGHEEQPELAPDNIGLELLLVKTVVDCLDQHG